MRHIKDTYRTQRKLKLRREISIYQDESGVFVADVKSTDGDLIAGWDDCVSYEDAIMRATNFCINN